MRISIPIASLFALIAGCAVDASGTRGGTLSVEVAPLALPGLSKVCYDLRVTNEPAAAGTTVWAAGNPSVDGPGDTDAMCSNAYGNGASGAITFVGACDASPKNPGDPGRVNSVTVWVDGLYAASTNALISPTGADGWQDPCPSGCTLDTLCTENADAKVEFNLTILRQANQGFFDIGVTFEDIFCSAKVDCLNGQGQPLDLLFNPSTGQRDTTVVAAFACTASPGASTDTVLYRDPLVVTCGGEVMKLDPTVGKGNAYTASNPDPSADAIWQYAIYAGEEALQCAGSSCNKQYWNVAIGLDETRDDCVLTTRMTAAPAGAFTALKTPLGTTYPYIDVTVGLTNGPGLLCTTHPVNGGNGVATVYTSISQPEAFDYSFDGAAFGKVADSIVTAGLIQHLDASVSASYPGSGSSWFDLSGQGHHGTLLSGATHSTQNGGVMLFDGQNDYIQTSLNYSLSSPSTNFTVGVWLKVASVTSSANRLAVSNYDGVPIPWNLYVQNSTSGKFAGYSRDNNNVTVAVPSLTRIDDFKWHHCVYAKNGNIYSVWVDGVLENSVTANLGVTTVARGTVLGVLNRYFNDFFHGQIGRLEAYDRALSHSEVVQNFNATKSRFGF